MSALTIALAVLGALVLVGLGVHGAWAARAASRHQEMTMQPHPTRVEPSAAAFEGELAGSTTPPDDGIALNPAAADSFAAKRHSARIDPLIDAVATLALEAPLGAEQITPHLPGSWRAGSKPFLIEGLNAASSACEPIAAGQQYSELRAGVQLANRSGAINEIEYSEFVQMWQRVADAIGATPEFPDMLDVVARARDLDAFAGQHDAQLAVHLHARAAAWSVGFVAQHAARHGFVPGALPGRLILPSRQGNAGPPQVSLTPTGGATGAARPPGRSDDGAPPVLTLSFDPHAALADDPQRAIVRDVTLSFDVPQTDPLAEPFSAWQASARALSLGMDAEIVDDQGQPISEAGFNAIGAELEALYVTLREHELAAGSLAARRLFS